MSKLSASAPSWTPTRLSATAASWKPSSIVEEKVALEAQKLAAQKGVSVPSPVAVSPAAPANGIATPAPMPVRESSACTIRAPPSATTADTAPPAATSAPAAPAVEPAGAPPAHPASAAKPPKFSFSGSAKPFSPSTPAAAAPAETAALPAAAAAPPAAPSAPSKFAFSGSVKPFSPAAPAAAPAPPAKVEAKEEAAIQFPSDPEEGVEAEKAGAKPSVLTAGALPFTPKSVAAPGGVAQSPAAELVSKPSLSLNPTAAEFRPSSLGRVNTMGSLTSSRPGPDSASSSRASSVAGERDSPAKALTSSAALATPTNGSKLAWRRTGSYDCVEDSNGAALAPLPEVAPAPRPVPTKDGKHPLRTPWTLWYRPVTNPSASTTSDAWCGALKSIYTFSDVETFWAVFTKIRAPTSLVKGATYYLFRDGIQPAWEDPVCEQGGEWKVWLPTQRRSEVDTIWVMLALQLIGEQLMQAEDICGVAVETRSKSDRISLWTKTTDKQRTMSVGRELQTLLQTFLPPDQPYCFTSHQKSKSGMDRDVMYCIADSTPRTSRPHPSLPD